VHKLRVVLAATIAVAAFVHLAPSRASAQQQGQQWFVPGGGGGAGGAQQQQPRPRPPQQQQARPPAQGGAPFVPPQGGDEPEPPSVQVQLPPVPELPPLPRGTQPPASVMGVISVRDVFRNSAAAQQLERVMGERRDRFQADVQKEQNAWRDLQQSFANQRGQMNADQIRAKERELQDRVSNAQRQFRDRQRILQEAYAFAGAQIERATILVVRQVAESRGMNMVLHREQIIMNAPEFDLTETVTQQLNRMLPTVVIPPDGMPVAQFAPPATGNGDSIPATAVTAPTAVPAPPAPPAAPAQPRR
jgi:Skp family chaperone for outer membrane proteins